MRSAAIFLATTPCVFACSAGGTVEDGPSRLFSRTDGGPTQSGIGENSGLPAPGAGGMNGTFVPPTTRGPEFNGPDGSCQSFSKSAERVVKTETVEKEVPVAIYIVQDISLSMLGQKWTQAQTAITSFVNDPSSAGLDVALTTWPNNTGQCDGTGYNTPQVPIGRLPDPTQIQAITNAINNVNLGGITPLSAALNGGVQFCEAFQAQHPDEKCVVVLITDGQPDQCEILGNNIPPIAQTAFSQFGVKTFTVGMSGADFNLLDQIAVAGGTDCTPNDPNTAACDVSGGGTSFLTALQLIRSKVTTTVTTVQTTKIDCAFTIPDPPAGATFDRDKVNVEFTNNGVASTILQVPTAADCAKYGNQGWFYDDPNAPKTIQVCPSTCHDIQSASGPSGTFDGGGPVASPTAPRVDILLGCQTQRVPPA